jgi:predicted O-methyltransferase YrrM
MIKILCRYIFYKLFAPHRKGFGVHSPFVFHLVTKVFGQRDDENLREILAWRKGILQNPGKLETSDIGAGSKIHGRQTRSIKQIARKSSIRHKYGRILYALVKEYKPSTIIELGTGIGISTAYLAKACAGSGVVSIEGDKGKVNFAAKSLELMELRNVTLLNGFFKDLLPELLTKATHPVLIFVDGDHSYNSTLAYYEEILKSLNPETIVVFDDIRWSDDMEKAWDEIKKNKATVISIDLFFMGIVFFRGGITKQDFVINF